MLGCGAPHTGSCVATTELAQQCKIIVSARVSVHALIVYTRHVRLAAWHWRHPFQDPAPERRCARCAPVHEAQAAGEATLVLRHIHGDVVVNALAPVQSWQCFILSFRCCMQSCAAPGVRQVWTGLPVRKPRHRLCFTNRKYSAARAQILYTVLRHAFENASKQAYILNNPEWNNALWCACFMRESKQVRVNIFHPANWRRLGRSYRSQRRPDEARRRCPASVCDVSSKHCAACCRQAACG